MLPPPPPPPPPPSSSSPLPSHPLATHPHQTPELTSPLDSTHDLHMKWAISHTDSAHTLTPLSGGHHEHHDHLLPHYELGHHHGIDLHAATAKYVADQEPVYKPVSQRRLNLEGKRPGWLRECVAEATGVFIFVLCGISSIASFTLYHGDKHGIAPYGSILQIGWAFGVGVALAIMTCAPVSGGHFNPAITLAMAFWQGFPWRKVPRYIISQIFGAFIAGMLLMACYWNKIEQVSAQFREDGRSLVGHAAPASILCSMPREDQTLGHLFAVEFFADTLIGVAVWAALDPANPFVTPASIPVMIGLAYASMIWGFGSQTLSTNLARDLGTRMVAAIFFGKEAFTQMGYAPIGMFVNIPATLLGTAYYELWIRDSFAIIGKGHAKHREGDAGLYRHMRKEGMLDVEQGVAVPEGASSLRTKQH